jgi:hypothetical protein
MVVPFACDVAGEAGTAGLLAPLFCEGRAGQIKTGITDSCARNHLVSILSKQATEFLIFSRPLVWTGLHFSAIIRRN